MTQTEDTKSRNMKLMKIGATWTSPKKPDVYPGTVEGYAAPVTYKIPAILLIIKSKSRVGDSVKIVIAIS